MEESARLLASNQQVIKWLNKELNDAQLVPGGVTAAAAAAVAEAELAYGGRAAASPPPPPRREEDGLGDYGFGGAGAGAGLGGARGSRGGDGKDVMFTTGLRESLTGGVSWNLRGTTLDGGGGGGDQNGGYFSYRDEAATAAAPAGAGEGHPNRGVESTPDHAGRGGGTGGVGRGGYSRIVTPESAGISDPAEASSRFLDGNISKGVLYGDGGGGDGKELAGGREGLDGGAVRGIRAF